jgi:hypothetical protein
MELSHYKRVELLWDYLTDTDREDWDVFIDEYAIEEGEAYFDAENACIYVDFGGKPCRITIEELGE